MNEYKRGDLLYRFRFDLDGEIVKDVFKITDINSSKTLRLEPVVERSATFKHKQGLWLNPENGVGVVKTKSLTKYVMISSDDEEEARRILLEYVTRQRDEFLQKLERVEQWILVAKGENHD